MTERRLLFALDIDGTLVNYDGEMADCVRDAVHRAISEGHDVVACTGRSLAHALPVLQRLDLRDGYVITSNGSVISQFDETGTIKKLHAVSFDPTAVLHELTEHLPRAAYCVELTSGDYLLHGHFPDGVLEGNVMMVEEIADLHTTEAVRVCVCGPVEEFSHYQQVAARIEMECVAFLYLNTSWIDFATPGINKASSLAKVCSLLPMAPTRVCAVGDAANDVEMLQWADCGYVMGQAPQWVKDAGDFVVAPVTECGAAEAIWRELDHVV